MPPHGHIHGRSHNDAFLLGPPGRAAAKGRPRSSLPRGGRLRLARHGDAVTTATTREFGAEGEDIGVELAAGVPGADDASKDAVGHAGDDLSEGVGAEGRDDEQVGPPAQLDVQDGGAAGPGLAPLVRVAVDAVDTGHRGHGRQRGLLGGLASQEASRARGQEHPDREVIAVLGQRLDDVGNLDATECLYVNMMLEPRLLLLYLAIKTY